MFFDRRPVDSGRLWAARVYLTLFQAIIWLSLAMGVPFTRAACSPCLDYAPAAIWGSVSASPLTEASGMVSSARNAGVLWTHNDGSREKLYALSTNGALLATFNLAINMDDFEDIALGPGPTSGVSYLYLGDIGGNVGTNTTRSSVQILRVAEPAVNLGWAANPPSTSLEGIEHFSLQYPDGAYDAECLLVDPLSGILCILTKQNRTRLYGVQLAGAMSGETLVLEFLGNVPFADVSGGDVSPDGTQIALRREDAAMLWTRCNQEDIALTLSFTGESIPVMGPPEEPNGEGLGFLRDNLGYVTISEGAYPAIYHFQPLCPVLPRFTLGLSNQSAFLGGSIVLRACAIGYPLPTYEWRFAGQALSGQTNSSLVFTNLALNNAGLYEVVARNAHGSVTNSATLTVRAKPDLRITEVMPSATSPAGVSTADWWELTSLESQPVNLSRWRFNDSSGGLTDPFVMPDGLVIGPRESIVFVEGITPAEFRSWWGTANLPANLQIITYAGNGLSFSATADAVLLWNDTTTSAADTITGVSFGAADRGVTFNYNPVTGVFGEKSQLGVNGVFRAAAATDIGSPGAILAPLARPRLTASLVANRIRLQFQAALGRRYELQALSGLGSETWVGTGDVFTPNSDMTVTIEKERLAAARFYRVVAY